MKKSIKKAKEEFEPKIIPIFEEVSNKISLLAKQMNSTNPLISEKDKPESELKINVRLTTQRRHNITNEKVKTLTITWKDKKEYQDFIRYGLTNEKLMTNSENETEEKEKSQE